MGDFGVDGVFQSPGNKTTTSFSKLSLYYGSLGGFLHFSILNFLINGGSNIYSIPPNYCDIFGGHGKTVKIQ